MFWCNITMYNICCAEGKNVVKKDRFIILYLGIIIIVLVLVLQTITDIKKIKNQNEIKTDGNNLINSGNNINNSDDSDAFKETGEEQWLAFFNNKINELKEKYPDGMYFNHMGMDEDEIEGLNIITCTDIACNHSKNSTKYCDIYNGKSSDAYPYSVAGRQSVGFASMLSDMIFGEDAHAYEITDYDNVRIGDQARIDGDTQTVFIIEKTDEYIIVSEVNENGQNCLISWGRKIMKKDLKGAFYISRY